MILFDGKDTEKWTISLLGLPVLLVYCWLFIIPRFSLVPIANFKRTAPESTYLRILSQFTIRPQSLSHIETLAIQDEFQTRGGQYRR
jgi:hypothetical protein